MKTVLTIFREANVERCQRSWRELDEWSPMQWAEALLGEAQEVLAEAQEIDLERITDEQRLRIARELADVISYADLLAADCGIELWPALVEKFNVVSLRRGSPLFLTQDVRIAMRCRCQRCHGFTERRLGVLHEYICDDCDMVNEVIDYRARDSWTPALYRCHGCSAHGVKLWRLYNTFLDNQRLLCCDCACQSEKEDPSQRDADGKAPYIVCGAEHGRTDQIGSLIPAVPTEDCSTFWGYTSVPHPGVMWWRALPLRVQP